MLETARYEGRGKLLASLVAGGSLAALGALMTAITPGIVEDFDIGSLVENFPPGVVESLGLSALATPGGFVAIELYEYVWIVGLGAYVAYAAAGTVAGDVERHRMDLILSAPVSRVGVLAEKFLAFLVPVVIINVVVAAAVLGANAFVSAGVEPARIVATHLLSVPYLLVCVAIGMVASVFAPRRATAEGVAAGVVVVTFVLSTLLSGTDFDRVTALSPANYYDPLAILTEGSYDLAGGAILLAATLVLLAVAAVGFRRRDIG